MAAAAKKKARVLRAFYDIEAGVDRAAGEVFECAAARFDEIVKAYPGNPLIEAVSAAKAPAKKAPEPTEAA